MAEPTKSAIVALFPKVDEVVAPYRMKLDPSAPWGVPAHVTVLYPFVPPHAISRYLVNQIQEVAGRLHAVDVRFERIACFGEQVVYAAPEPDEWFRVATLGIFHAFPDYPPYDGEIEDPTPHLTIGDGGPGDEMKRAGKEIEERLPLQQRLEHLALMVGSEEPDSWSVLHEFELGAW